MSLTAESAKNSFVLLNFALAKENFKMAMKGKEVQARSMKFHS